MSFWNSLFSCLGGSSTIELDDDSTSTHQGMGWTVNPSSGLPMVDGSCSGVDVAGNPYGYGTDLHDDYWTTPAMHDDIWPSS